MDRRPRTIDNLLTDAPEPAWLVLSRLWGPRLLKAAAWIFLTGFPSLVFWLQLFGYLV